MDNPDLDSNLHQIWCRWENYICMANPYIIPEDQMKMIRELRLSG